MLVERADVPDEYFAECDEHLGVARKSVLALEASVGHRNADPELLDEMFRSFHSIKGLSAMVGIAEAEQLAHAMESFLGSLRRGERALTGSGLAVLAEGVKTLDTVVADRRDGRKTMDVAPLVESIAAAVEEPSSSAAANAAPTLVAPGRLTEREKARLQQALAAGARAFCFTFAPNPALDARGVNVGSVRERLAELGELIQATPQVEPGGAVKFAFVVATTAADETLSAMVGNGIHFVEYDPSLTAGLSAKPEGAAIAEAPATVDVLRPRTNLVRVELSKLDELMRMVGELVVTRGRLEQSLRGAGLRHLSEYRAIYETNSAFERQLRELREAVTRVRLVPVREAFERMRFVVRDLTRGSDKTVHLELIGEETEVDKLVVERMIEPLLHLVRNAVSHGLESTPERIATGKPAAGRLALRAATAGENVVIEIEDDGRGIDLAAVRSRAFAAGLIAPGAEIGPLTLLEILTMPGFSTRDEADRASGRGVGMAAVRAAVHDLGGSLAMTTRPSAGTCFTIHVPVSLAIVDALIVTVGNQRFAVPRTAVREVVRVESREITTFAADEILKHRNQPVHLVRLGRAFNISSAGRDVHYVLMVGDDNAPVGLVVDGVERLREIVVRPLLDPLVRQRGLSGATELGDRRAVLILDIKSLVERQTVVSASLARPEQEMQ
jgi:two-component system chemotaxis sensor kinase CheA